MAVMTASEPAIKIAVLFKDTFNLHGDRGNISAITRVSDISGIKTDIDYVDFTTEDFTPGDYDMIYCGPGEISNFTKIKGWLLPKKNELDKFISDGKVLLAIGTTLCLFGNDTIRTDGSVFTGLSVINCGFKERKAVAGDDLHYTVDYNGQRMEIFGSQIQMIDIISSEPPFGTLIYGMGNNDGTKNEGVLLNNSIFTNTLGPMLVLNPWLTKEIINAALTSAGYEFTVGDFDMETEKSSLEAKKRFTAKKQGR